MSGPMNPQAQMCYLFAESCTTSTIDGSHKVLPVVPPSPPRELWSMCLFFYPLMVVLPYDWWKVPNIACQENSWNSMSKRLTFRVNPRYSLGTMVGFPCKVSASSHFEVNQLCFQGRVRSWVVLWCMNLACRVRFFLSNMYVPEVFDLRRKSKFVFTRLRIKIVALSGVNFTVKPGRFVTSWFPTPFFMNTEGSLCLACLNFPLRGPSWHSFVGIDFDALTTDFLYV